MSSRSKKLLASIGGLMAVAVGVYAYAAWAVREVDPFYAAAIRSKPEQLEADGRRMESRVTALYSDALPPGRWQTVFTDDEVNGWLAVILEEKYSELLPPEVTNPRVAFTQGGCQIGYRYEGKRIKAVISVEGEAFMASEDIAALRLKKARLGALPLPMSQVVAEINEGAATLKIPVKWTQQAGDPVLLVLVTNALSTDEEGRQLEQIELRDGELVLAGSTTPRPAAEADGSRQTPRATLATATAQ